MIPPARNLGFNPPAAEVRIKVLAPRKYPTRTGNTTSSAL